MTGPYNTPGQPTGADAGAVPPPQPPHGASGWPPYAGPGGSPWPTPPQTPQQQPKKDRKPFIIGGIVGAVVIAAVVVVTVLALMANADDKSHDRAKLMKYVTSAAQSTYGGKDGVKSVTCPQNPPTTIGAVFTCTVDVVDDPTLTITVTVADRGWRMSMNPTMPSN
ncbi:DUF4333 domain-containing protein [Gordonia sp. DT30]|uniref:DUF4333 domain-containing protein n=1 Tax=unclassified Gordonia (in: high G+C Gram-positive bacteria) TaxID=2657482 RepID=UPI003CEB0558